MANNWTSSQREAIEARGSNLLVSAGAGSGKTTVMIARIVDLITREKISIADFLVVTFTKASAADMKAKLIKALEKLPPDEFVLEQIEMVGTSDVSNLHSFCARLLKQYFYKIGLDPAFIVLDETEMSVLKNKAMKKLFANCLSRQDAEMLELADILNKNRSDIGLSEAINAVFEYNESQIDPNWFEKLQNQCYNSDFSQNFCLKYLNLQMVNIFKAAKNEFTKYLKMAISSGDEKFGAYIENLIFVASQISAASSVEMNIYNLFNLPSMKTIPAKVNQDLLGAKEALSSYREKFAERIKDMREWWGTGDITKIREHLSVNAQRIKALFRLTLEYTDILTGLKQSRGGLDFGDLEKWTLKLLAIDEVREGLQNKYKYIFVDEYQDINAVQEKIITLLSRENNRFMVGDIKQSIYRFRLCDPEIFLNKYNTFGANASGKLVRLKENFRSNPQILSFANFVFNKCYTKDFGGIDYAQEGNLVCGSGEWESGGEKCVEFDFLDTANLKKALKPQQAGYEQMGVYSVIEHVNPPRPEVSVATAEAQLIAHRINDLVGEKMTVRKGEEPRTIHYRDIVILLASRGEYLKEFSQEIARWDIPVSSDSSTNVFEDEIVQNLLCFLKILDNFAQDYPLFAVLTSPLFNLEPADMADIKLLNPDKKNFYKAVAAARNCEGLGEYTKTKLSRFFEKYDKFKALSKFLGAKELVLKIVDELDVKTIALMQKESEATLQKINRFISSLTPKSLAQNLIDIENSEVVCDNVAVGDSVRIMTIHASKGLEFPVVFLAHCGKEFSRKSNAQDLVISKDFGIGIRYYNEQERFVENCPVRSAITLNETRKNNEEQLRLLYVALTRAVNKLLVVASGQIDVLEKDKPNIKASSFLDFFAPVVFDKLDKTNALGNIADINFYDALDGTSSRHRAEYAGIKISGENEPLKQTLIDVLSDLKAKQLFSSAPAKTSVTAINTQEKEIVPVLFEDEKSGFSPELGTAYHKILQQIDYFGENSGKIDEKIAKLVSNNEITHEISQKIDKNIIERIRRSPIIQENKNAQFLREREFIMRIDNETKADDSKLARTQKTGSNFTVVQGICDLIIKKKNSLILIDFKLSNKSPQKLIESYKTQIALYSRALTKSFKMPIEAAYICKLTTGEFIKVEG